MADQSTEYLSSFISFEGVAYAYASNGPFVFRDFNLDIPRGSFFVLVGPSGCGKTTLLNLIAGFTKPSEGRVLVDGKPVSRPGRDRLVIFQGYESLLDWLSVEKNVGFGLRIAGVPRSEWKKRVHDALSQVSLAGQGHKYPHQLSGGMKQRVQLARALVCDCDVMLMDEPFGGVDALTRSSLQDELTTLCASTERTVFFITHDISEAVALGDFIGVMGKDSASGLKRIIANDLPRPRSRGDERFGALYAQVEEALAS